jgi:hypothetical protein
MFFATFSNFNGSNCVLYKRNYNININICGIYEFVAASPEIECT